VIIAVVALVSLFPSQAQAGSVFAREGIGEWIDGYDVRDRALGSTGIGVADPYSFMNPNPAAGAFSTNTLVHAGLGRSVQWASDGEHTARFGSSAFAGFGVYLALPEGLGLRLLLRPATDGVYALEEVVETGSGNQDNIRREEGSRGLIFYGADLLWRGGQTWAVAAGAGLITGSLRDETTYTFADSGWGGSSEQRTMRFKPAAVFSGGVLLKPWRYFSLGGFVSSRASSNLTEDYCTSGGTDWERESSFGFPLAFGAGVSIHVMEQMRLSGDLIWRGWEDARVDGASLPQPGLGPFQNTLRWGVGLERTPLRIKGSSAWQRLSLRLGFAWVPWYVLDSTGDGVDEWRLSAGVGLPIRMDRGSIDLTTVWGHRGSGEKNGLDEDYFYFGAGFTFARVLREY
jgi:hypothetical protein